MSWAAVDDHFHSHRKVLRLRRSPHYPEALSMWVLAMSWCTGQQQEKFTGIINADVLTTFGLADPRSAAAALVEVGLWEVVDDETFQFHDWDEWNGIGGKEMRSKEQVRLRQEAHRLKKCKAGQHDRHCPKDSCPKKAGDGGSRDPGTGRGREGDGPGRAEPGSDEEEVGAVDESTGEVADPGPLTVVDEGQTFYVCRGCRGQWPASFMVSDRSGLCHKCDPKAAAA